MQAKVKRPEYPIKHWSHSSLMAFLRNPLAWHKRYVEQIYDTPSGPASIIGRAGHTALQHFYGGVDKEGAIALGLEYLRNVADFEINFGKKTSKTACAKETRKQWSASTCRRSAFIWSGRRNTKCSGLR